MNKRGFIFTFISVVLVSVLMLAFLINYTSRTRTDIERTNTEVETMNSFVKSLNNDYLPRALQTSGNQAILALLHHMSVSDNYMSAEDGGATAQNFIRNAIVDGDYEWDLGVGGGNPAPKLELMQIEGVSYNLSSVLNEVVNLANFTGIIFYFDEINKNDVTIFQDNPWYVNFTMSMTYTVTDKNQDISWSYTDKEIKASIPIIYFRDPIYMVAIAQDANPEDGINITINKTTYDIPSEIVPHVENTNFLACNSAPSFLDRMQGNVGISSQQGIESMVNIKDSQQSSVDYQYIFGGNYELRQIGSSGYFIDLSHSECYNLGEGGEGNEG